MSRRGRLLRPFSQRHGLRHRGCSARLERALVDFGAEESFARAADRVREHYGLAVSVWQVRVATYKHAGHCGARRAVPPAQTVATLVTELDGSMIPVVETRQTAPDRRATRKLHWREARLCLARAQHSASPVYGATLGGAQLTGSLWRDVAVDAGLGEKTRVHGVGDGATWIVDQFDRQFGTQGAYLLDFYHLSEYLAQAAPAQRQPKAWLRRHQGYLLQNRVGPTLQSLARRLEPAGVAEQPVRAAHRYLSERRGQLDYAGALAADLPIGSGQIESGHRHVIQQRLKLAGAWWNEANAEAMLALRASRANGLWEAYWKTTLN